MKLRISNTHPTMSNLASTQTKGVHSGEGGLMYPMTLSFSPSPLNNSFNSLSSSLSSTSLTICES